MQCTGVWSEVRGGRGRLAARRGAGQGGGWEIRDCGCGARAVVGCRPTPWVGCQGGGTEGTPRAACTGRDHWQSSSSRVPVAAVADTRRCCRRGAERLEGADGRGGPVQAASAITLTAGRGPPPRDRGGRGPTTRPQPKNGAREPHASVPTDRPLGHLSPFIWTMRRPATDRPRRG